MFWEKAKNVDIDKTLHTRCRTTELLSSLQRDALRSEIMEVEQERDRRHQQFEALNSRCGSTQGVPASVVNELRIFFGGRGIWYDATRTKSIADPGITVGVLHTGRVYADDLAEDCIVYHYPKTKSPGKDAAEVSATKNAGLLSLPLFVVVDAGSKRDVFMAWVADWDDSLEQFLFEFGPSPTKPELHTAPTDVSPFSLVEAKTWKTSQSKVRPGQSKFSYAVLKRYGAACAACGINVKGLTDAAHVVPDSENGSNDPRNGLPLCPTHHRAFDKGHLLVEPSTREFCSRDNGPSLSDLGVTKDGLFWLPAIPHTDALQWHWDKHIK
jgi:putative restriction endonuclease